LYGLTTIGTATVEKFQVRQGLKNVTAHGYLSKDMTKENPEILGRFLTSLYIQTSSNPATALSLKGKTATIDSAEIKWLSAAVQRLHIPLSAVNKNPQEDIVGGLDLGFSVDFSQFNILATDGFVAAKYNFPFASGGSDTVVTKTEHRLEFSTIGNVAFARINAQSSLVSVRVGKSISEFKSTEIQVLDAAALSQGFLERIIQEQNFSISVNDTVTAEVDTGMGAAKLEDIVIPKVLWTISGYGGFGKKNLQLVSPEIMQSNDDGLQFSVKAQLEGAGGVGLKVC
jgi:hypothetical protein